MYFSKKILAEKLQQNRERPGDKTVVTG